MKYSTIFIWSSSRSKLIVIEIRGEMVDLYLAWRRSRLPTINVTAERVPTVFALRAIRGVPSRGPYRSLSRDTMTSFSWSADTRPSPIFSIPLSGIPEGRATPLHNRSAAPHETAIRMSHFQIVSFQFFGRSATDHRRAYQRNCTTKKKRFTLASGLNILISSRRGWFR